MKKLLILFVPALLFFGCSNETTDNTEDNTDDTNISTENMVELNLAEYGLPLLMMVPQATNPNTGDPLPAMVEAHPDDFLWHVKVGEGYHLIIEDMGSNANHISDVKSEHSSTTNIYDITYVVDEPDGLLWAQTVPGSGLEDRDGNLKAFYHVEVYLEIDGISYEIYTDPMDEFSEGQGNSLYASARSIKSNAPA